MIHAITGYAFLRSQRPELKTDYQNFIVSPACPLEIVLAFERIHEALHRNFPPRPVRLSFPVETDAGPFLCQCLCGVTPSPEGRSFLALGGIAVKVSDLRFAEINPVALLVAADFTGIVQDMTNTDASANSVVQREVMVPPNFGVQADKDLRRTLATRLVSAKPGKPVAWPAGTDLFTMLCSLYYAYQDCPPEHWYRTAFALELAADAELPIPLTLTVLPNVPAGSSPAATTATAAPIPAATTTKATPAPPTPAPPVVTAPTPRTAPSRAGRQRLQALERLADALRQQRGIDEFWCYRLWHYCQDVLGAAERCLEADDNHRFAEADRLLNLVQSRQARLEEEIARAFTTAETRPIAGDLTRELHEWFETIFVPSLHITQTGRRKPSRPILEGSEVSASPPSLLPVWAWGVIVALATAVVLLLWQRLTPAEPPVTHRPLSTRSHAKI